MNYNLNDIKYQINNIRRLERCLSGLDRDDPHTETEVNGLVHDLNDAVSDFQWNALVTTEALVTRIEYLEDLLHRIANRPSKYVSARTSDAWHLGYDDSTAVATSIAMQAFEDKDNENHE